MRKPATTEWEMFILLMDFIVITRQSIAGITYHDDFGVDEKYRNIQECDPFYWHPLHLPEQCAEMFADLIRSRVATAAKSPVRLLTRRKRPDYGWPEATKIEEDIYSLRRYYKYVEPEYEQPIYENKYTYGNDYDYLIEPFEQSEPIDLLPSYLSSYDKMLEFLRQDISKNPIAPVVGMSNYGPVAMYQQPVSRKSKNIIQKMARAYARTNTINNNENDGYYYGKIEFPSDNSTSNNKNTRNNKKKLKGGKTKKKNAKKKAKNQKRTNGIMIQ